MAQEEDIHSLEAKFAAAVKVIRSLPEDGNNLCYSSILHPNLSMKVMELSKVFNHICIISMKSVLAGV